MFQENDVQVLDWPAQSPDLNPIEKLWNDLDKALMLQKPSNLDETEAYLIRVWGEITAQRCEKLVDSMPRRCAAVIKNKGYPTKY